MNAHSPAFGRSPPTVPPRRPRADVRLTPGAYLRHCRMAAGVTVQDCARKIAVGGVDQARAYHDIHELEQNRPGDYGRLVTCLHESGAFKFDFAKFLGLAAETCDPDLDPGASA